MRYIAVILSLLFLPWSTVVAVGAPDPLFPCAVHKCACSTRLKCLSHCCCFPGKKKDRTDQRPKMKSCGGFEEKITQIRAEILIEKIAWVYPMPQNRFVPEHPSLYTSLPLDVFTPPPRA